MHRGLFCLAVAAGLGLWVQPSSAGVLVMPPAGPARVLNSDAVFVGKVVGLEPQDVQVMNVTYRIAVVQIEQPLHGVKKDDKMLRVAFQPPAGPGGKGPFIPGIRGVQLQVGQEGMFLVKKHDKEKFYTFVGPAGYFISSQNNANFEKDVATVKATVKLMDNPQAALKSKDAEERLLAAALLIEKYRTFRGPGKLQTEPIDAAESKQILLALADADWQVTANPGSLRASPQQLFNRLGVTAKDGWMPPPGLVQPAAIQSWLRDNAEKYRIQRLVSSDAK
jgi:hypothetical protein